MACAVALAIYLVGPGRYSQSAGPGLVGGRGPSIGPRPAQGRAYRGHPIGPWPVTEEGTKKYRVNSPNSSNPLSAAGANWTLYSKEKWRDLVAQCGSTKNP